MCSSYSEDHSRVESLHTGDSENTIVFKNIAENVLTTQGCDSTSNMFPSRDSATDRRWQQDRRKSKLKGDLNLGTIAFNRCSGSQCKSF